MDGVIPKSVCQRLITLAGNFRIYVLTADTNGTAKEQCEQLPVYLQTFPSGNARDYKKELLKSVGARRCAAFGNGRNDELMLKEAAFSVAVMGKEGVYGKLLKEADALLTVITEGIFIFFHT